MLTIIPSNDSLSYYGAIAAAWLIYGTVKAALFDHHAITSHPGQDAPLCAPGLFATQPLSSSATADTSSSMV